MQWSCTRSPVMILAMLILWGSSQIWDSKWMPFHLGHTDCTVSPEKQCRDRTRSTGYRSGQWDAHQIPRNFIMFEQLKLVASIKMQWLCTRWPVMILDMLIMWRSFQIWESKYMPFHLGHTVYTFSSEKQWRYRTRSTGYRSGQWDAHQIPCNFIMFEQLNLVARIKMHWYCIWSPIMILAKLILWGSSQIWDLK